MTPATTSAEAMIRFLDLKPLLFEGGFYRETYPPRIDTRQAPPPKRSSAIFYLVTPASFSALHRLTIDEIYHFYLGDPCEMIEVDSAFPICRTILGPDLAAGQQVQHLVKAGNWQGCRLVAGGRWALFGTTMAPGFNRSAFTLADEAVLESIAPADRPFARQYLAPAAAAEPGSGNVESV